MSTLIEGNQIGKLFSAACTKSNDNRAKNSSEVFSPTSRMNKRNLTDNQNILGEKNNKKELNSGSLRNFLRKAAVYYRELKTKEDVV